MSSILTLKCYSSLAGSDGSYKNCLPTLHILDAIDLFLNPRQRARVAMLREDVSGVSRLAGSVNLYCLTSGPKGLIVS